jgi:hypothetical protein
VEVGDLVRHKWDRKAGTGIVMGVSRNGPPDMVYVTAVWSADWINGRSIEQQYLEVISASR